MTGGRPRSLRRLLVVRLLLLQVGILFAFGVAFVAYLVQADEGGVLVSPEFAEVAVRAIVRETDGSLRLRETDALAALRRATPDFWFVARSAGGEIVESGPVPALYAALAQHLDRITFADIRDSEPPFTYLAIIRRASGPAGAFVVLGKGKLFSTTFVVLFLSNLLMLPILLLLTVVTTLAIPWIVGRALSRLAAVAREAEAIDIDRRGGRLSKAEVPLEIVPLVSAINGALQRLDDGYARQQRFILDAAHELRTPIAILQTRLDALPADPVRARLLADAARIAGLAEQLLDMQRLGHDAHFRRVDLTALCRDVVADLAPLAIAAGYELSLEAGDDPVTVSGDGGALERVMTNLIQNAIEHGGGGGQILVRVEAGGVVEVADEGPGIPQAEREAIFEPFHRLQPRDHGAGLGLNLARAIALRHGGQISVSAAPTGGACFRLALPLCE